MSDTTAYLAGCATTGVAALVLLVARVGMVSANSDGSRTNRLDDRLARVEAQIPSPSTNQESGQLSEARLEYEIRRELEKQQALTKQLEDQLQQQETLSGNLEEQLQAQEEKTRDLLTRIQDYQRSVEDMEIDDKIAAASRPAIENARPTTPVSVIWLGAGAVVVLVLGGAGLIACAVVLILQSQRRSARTAPMPPPMPMPPAAGYRYYDQTFLPPPQLRPRRPSYYDYPTPPYDYNQ
ncbi:MAG: hypothetical protein AB8B99_06080 [Phormidesmis sp.]